MSLARVKNTYERFGSTDPMYAVLSVDEFKGNQGDAEKFFELGREEISGVMEYLKGVNRQVARHRALDFGCGAGRLSQALADHFSRVDGVDIAESMVSTARGHNRHGDRVQYHVNAVDHLELFASGTFDFIYSNITLQHVPPEASTNYIREFMRLLTPNGVAIFQVPSGTLYAEDSVGAFLYRVHRHHLRPLWKKLRGRHPVEIHYVPKETVHAIVDESSCSMVDIVRVNPHRREENYRYCVSKSK